MLRAGAHVTGAHVRTYTYKKCIMHMFTVVGERPQNAMPSLRQKTDVRTTMKVIYRLRIEVQRHGHAYEHQQRTRLLSCIVRVLCRHFTCVMCTVGGCVHLTPKPLKQLQASSTTGEVQVAHLPIQMMQLADMMCPRGTFSSVQRDTCVASCCCCVNITSQQVPGGLRM